MAAVLLDQGPVRHHHQRSVPGLVSAHRPRCSHSRGAAATDLVARSAAMMRVWST
jgi:hypothetical protein